MSRSQTPDDLFTILNSYEDRITRLERSIVAPTPIGYSARASDGTNPVSGPYGWTDINITGDVRLSTNHSQSGSAFTIPATGFYLLHVLGSWDVNSLGTRHVRIWSNLQAKPICVSEVNATGDSSFTQHGTSNVWHLTAGEVVRFQASQLSSGAIVSHRNEVSSHGSGMDIIFIGDAPFGP